MTPLKRQNLQASLKNLDAWLDAKALDVTYEDFLWCVSCFKSVDPKARLREAPESLTLDALLRVAAALDVEIEVRLVPAGT